MQLELVMYSIRKLVEAKTGASVFATYPPKDSKCFNSPHNIVGDDYHRFIMFTQVFEFNNASNIPVKAYLYYRNKRTHGYPEFSSCEFGIFIGNTFTSLFKEHIEYKDEKTFAQLIADKIINIIETI